MNKFIRLKDILKDIGIVTTSRGLSFLFAFVISILISRLTGPEGRGVYSLVSVSILFLSLVLSCGMEEAFPYYISRKDIKPSHLLPLGLPYLHTVVLSILLILFFIPLSWKRSVLPSLSALAFNLILLGTLFRIQGRIIGNSFLGVRNFWLFGYHLFSYPLYGLLIIPVLHFSRLLSVESVMWVPFLSSVLQGITFTIIIIFMFPPDFHEAFTSFSSVVKKYKKILGYGLFAQTGVILNFFNLRLDFYFINYFKGVKELGLYSIATAVGESLYLIPYAIGRMWFPRVAKNQAGKKEKTFQILLVTFIISSLTGIILIATGKLLLTFMFGEKFEGSYIPLIILIPGIISLGLSSVIASYFHGIGKPQWGTLMSVISISFTIILDFLLIPVYGIKGAAIASSIAYTISFLTGFFTIFRV